MNKYKIEIKWGIIFVVMTILWMTMEKLTGLHDVNIEKHATVTNLIFFPAIITYVLALLDKKKNFYNGTMSYKQGFISGVIISVVVALFSPITQYLTSVIISPDYFTNAIEYAVETEAQTREEAENFFNLNNFIVVGFIGSLIMGIITAAIVALFTKSK